jgi:hypothetical protein
MTTQLQLNSTFDYACFFDAVSIKTIIIERKFKINRFGCLPERKWLN